MIERERQWNRILEALSNFPVVGIVGPRQIGKTTLAKTISKHYDAVYLDLELDSDLNRLSEPELYLESLSGKTVILDEIQRKPELFPLLRALVDQDSRTARFVILGSASPDLLRQSSESLAGRIKYIELGPFSLEEVDFETNNLWIKGGFPMAYTSTFEKSFSWRKSFYTNYIERDLPALGLNTDRRILNNFIRMLAYDNGQLWNASRYAKSLGVSSPRVSSYLGYLDQTFLVRILEPWYTNIRKRITRSPKVYHRDSGILHAILDLKNRDNVFGHPVAGFSWESFVIEQIHFFSSGNYSFNFYRTQDGAEMDLVLSKSGKPEIGLEIKLSNAPKLSKGFLSSIDALNTQRNFIITPSSHRYPIHKMVEVISLKDFVTQILKA